MMVQGSQAPNVYISSCMEKFHELACNGLKKLLQSQGLVVSTGLLDDSPSTYSPFYRSTTDLFMYNKDYYKLGTVTSATHITDKDEEPQTTLC